MKPQILSTPPRGDYMAAVGLLPVLHFLAACEARTIFLPVALSYIPREKIPIDSSQPIVAMIRIVRHQPLPPNIYLLSFSHDIKRLYSAASRREWSCPERTLGVGISYLPEAAVVRPHRAVRYDAHFGARLARTRAYHLADRTTRNRRVRIVYTSFLLTLGEGRI